ncbi:MAG: 23S rRNA (adenine(2503)-C(2))-methyltransferase RlmN [Clostridia bacterium]|nr:23S rRNA (adenine(2503)-C(2))-methyltransferase RlmN [Clostridia bacterium]
MIDIKSMNEAEIASLMAEIGEPKFRAGQIFKWLSDGARSFDDMTNLSKSLREKLSTMCELRNAEMIRKQASKVDGTIKYLWRFPDGNCVESVFMEYKHGNTICISTQAGCRMGCKFCASTLAGLKRNLTPGEMLDQVIAAQRDTGKRVSNIVLMGTGEPLDNYDNVITFLKLAGDDKGLNIGMRHISLSTCGICDKIKMLAEENMQITLSISLHAPDNETRSKIMPINNRFPVEELIKTCKYYFSKTSRRISFEYTMIDGVSDTEECARKLATLLKGFPCHVNLIPLNPVSERDLKTSSKKAIERFVEILSKSGLTVTVRRSLGSDIDAACGQLRRKVENGDK